MDIEARVRVVAKPSNVVRSFRKRIVIPREDATYDLILVTMKRSFLLVINNLTSPAAGGVPAFAAPGVDQAGDMSDAQLIQSFINENSSLRGLSLAIGGHSTCLVPSDNSVASQALASRLSKALNQNGPVYVVNNAKSMDGTLDPTDDIASLHEKVFQFVRQNYTCPQNVGQEADSKGVK